MADAAKRNLLILSCAQALGAGGPPVIISLGGIIGTMLSPTKALATLPVSLFTIGLALATIPVGWLVHWFGRRPAYQIGSVTAIFAGLTACYGVVAGSFLIFCIGCTMAGINAACVQSYRFAAVDVAGSANRARAISFVMVGGLFGAVIGPQIVIWTRDSLPGVPFAGSFLGQAILAVLALVVLSGLRAPPVQTHATSGGRSLLAIALTPRFATAAGAGMVVHATMSFVMTAAPIAMVECGHSIGQAALGIQWHVLAMFGPSFVTGRIIERYGEERVTAFGLLLIALGAVIALSGLTLFHFWLDLILLGLGWNFGFIGATAMVAGSHKPEERAKVQSMNDFLVFGSTAIASLSSGTLVQTVDGWATIAWVTFPIVGIALLLTALSARDRRRAVA